MNQSFGYLPQSKRKKILLICDDIRVHSGVATVARELVINTAQHFNWVNVGGAINHPEVGKRLDLSADTNANAGIDDSSVVLYPSNGYGDARLIRQLIKMEKPDAIFLITDPRYFIWLFQMWKTSDNVFHAMILALSVTALYIDILVSVKSILLMYFLYIRQSLEYSKKVV